MPRPLHLISVLLLVCLGCASPGPPHPPSLHLPERATGLAAERIGDGVRLSWTSPVNTTDGDRIKGPMTAVVCRELPPRGGCVPVQRVSVSPGPFSASDELPAGLLSGPPRLLLYRVELQNAKGRSAGESEPVVTAAGTAPPPVGALTLSARRNAVLVRWAPAAPPAAAVMELKRTLVASADGSVQPAAARTTAKREGFLPSTKPAAGEATLRGAPPAGSAAADGLLDPTVTHLDRYRYVAQWVINATVSGHAVELRGLPSPPAVFTFRDVFPPQPPAGLVAIPGEGFGAPLSIDLSWESNAETDLLGYTVYRRTGQEEFRRLNADPVSAPAYRDQKIEAGQSYTYRVTAVDRRGNESGPSAEVKETPRP